MSNIVQKSPLNARQERFCSAMVTAPTGEQAALAAGYSPGGAARTATRLLKKPEIVARIEELREPVIKRTQASAADIIAEIERAAFADPEEPPTWSQKNRALDLLARIHSMYRDDAERLNVYVFQQIQNLPPATVERLWEDEGEFVELLDSLGYRNGAPALPSASG